MPKKYKIGVIGVAQMHVMSIIDAFNSVPDRIEWIGAADLAPIEPHNGDLRKKYTRTFNMDYVLKNCQLDHAESDYRAVIAGKPDMIIVCAENAFHGDIVCEILAHGITVILEKPMATSFADALRMARASKFFNAGLIINWPVAWRPNVHQIIKLAQDGAVGDIIKFHYRNPASMGSIGSDMTDLERSREWWYQAAAGGGAMLDYCGYGCLLSRLAIGEKAVTAYGMRANLNSPFADVEDYSAMIIQFKRAVGLIEGSWVTLNPGGIPVGPVVFGSKGVLVTHFNEPTIKLYANYSTQVNNEPFQMMEIPPLAPDRANIALEVLHHLDTGSPLYPILDMPVNLDAMAALDAGLRSARSGKLELVYDATLMA
jgi:predicted dehydrogenase